MILTGFRECVIAWEEGKPGSGIWNVFAFDGVMKEQQQGQVQVTQYPVDKGFIVSDHAIKMNRIIQIDSMSTGRGMRRVITGSNFVESFNELMLAVAQSNSSLTGIKTYDETGTQVVPDSSSLYTGASKRGFLAQDQSEAKLDDMVAIIDNLNATGTLVHVTTLRGMFPNCVIKQYAYGNDVHTATALPMSVTFEQITYVTAAEGKAVAQTPESGAEGTQEQANSQTEPQSNTRTYMTHVGQRTAKVVETKPIDPVKFQNASKKELPFAKSKPTSFLYNNVNYTLDRFRYNSVLERWVTSLSWHADGKEQRINGLVLTSGVDLIAQYKTGLPSLVVINGDELQYDSQLLEFMKIFLIEDYHEIFVER